VSPDLRPGMICTEVQFGSKLQIASLALRDRVLRRPLGMLYDPADLTAEAGEWHLAVLDETTVCAVLLLKKGPEGTLKMRQVAVDFPWQGKGLGRMLVHYAERFALEQGYRKITLHAREQAVAFYTKLNYHKYGEPFEEVGLPHFAMVRDL